MRHGGNVWKGGEPCRWLDFSANLRLEGPPAWVVEALHAAAADALYYPNRRMSAARQGLAAYLELPKNVLPTAGGAAAIDLVLSLRRGIVWTAPMITSASRLSSQPSATTIVLRKKPKFAGASG